MAAKNLEPSYNSILKGLEKAKVPCKVKLMDNEITIECGFNYPSRVYDKIRKAAEKLNISMKDICVCAEQSGGTVIKTAYVCGGPKRY
jgi:hypothetical protein